MMDIPIEEPSKLYPNEVRAISAALENMVMELEAQAKQFGPVWKHRCYEGSDLTPAALLGYAKSAREKLSFIVALDLGFQLKSKEQ